MKCLLCGKRKGKRPCPAKGGLICAQCCGEKRVVEIDCPSDCTYLSSGQAFQSVKKYTRKTYRQERGDPPMVGPLAVVHNLLERGIVQYSTGLSSFADRDVLEAVRLVKKTYQTEEKGIIFEHRHPNPLIESLSLDLHKLLEGLKEGKYQEKEYDDIPELRLPQIVRCLADLEAEVEYHLDHPESQGTYLKFIARNHPDAKSESKGEGLIVP